jgi:hypothetical protein
LFFVVPGSSRTSPASKSICRHSSVSTSLWMRQPCHIRERDDVLEFVGQMRFDALILSGSKNPVRTLSSASIGMSGRMAIRPLLIASENVRFRICSSRLISA